MILYLLKAGFVLSANNVAYTTEQNDITGYWKGIEIFQDKSSYDGKTYYLPNNEHIIIEKNKIHVYYYPYFKSDEFDATITPKSIVYTINKKKIKSDYFFQGDTLMLSMNFINKHFIKMYNRVHLDKEVIDELNEFGFNPSSVTTEFEPDTFHLELWKGISFKNKPDWIALFQYVQFIDDHHIKLNRGQVIEFERGYKSVKYRQDNKYSEFAIHHLEGTQKFTMIPSSNCNCDSIIIPYMSVSWANRIRKQLFE